MLKDYISVDIENPNSRGNSICSIGIVIVKNNEVVDEVYSLINPEDRFDIINSQITKLNVCDVKDAPTFKEFWNGNKDLFLENVIVGHNVTYDLSVISKSLDRYEIEVPQFRYLCTLELSQKFLESNSYKLDKLCENYDLTLEKHHNSLSDAKSAQQLFEYMNNNFDIDLPNTYYYEKKLKENLNRNLETNINNLYGIVQGINYDNNINEEEIFRLRKWIDDNILYKEYSLINKLVMKLEKILSDNYISEYEKLELIELVSNFKNSTMYNETTLSLQVLNGIMDGIIADKNITEKEIYNLNRWLEDNDYLADVYPYDKVVLEINKVLEDNIITQEEKDNLLKIFNEIINPSMDSNKEIEFYGKTFCLTGEFEYGSKSEVSELLTKNGAIEKNGVSSKLDYLIVGLVGSEAWKFGNYGGKILRAKELQEKGINIKIVDESILTEISVDKSNNEIYGGEQENIEFDCKTKSIKEIIFDKLENMIKDVKIDNFNIYEICEKTEKLKLNDEYKNETFSYKIFNNNILLKYNVMKKVSDFIEIRCINDKIFESINNKFDNVQYKENDLYIRINLQKIDQIDLIENEIKEIFSEMFLQYMNTEESFGCCSKYIECSDAKHCVHSDVRLRFSCMYKKNLDAGKIFYGKNRNIN